jgi:hypothetical protein
VLTVQRSLVLVLGDPQQRIGQVLAELVEAARVHGPHRLAVTEHGDQAQPQPVLGVVAVQPHTGGVGGDLADQRGEKLPVPLGEIVGRASEPCSCSAIRSTSVWTTGGNAIGCRSSQAWPTRAVPAGARRPQAGVSTLGKSRCDASSSVAAHPSSPDGHAPARMDGRLDLPAGHRPVCSSRLRGVEDV